MGIPVYLCLRSGRYHVDQISDVDFIADRAMDSCLRTMDHSTLLVQLSCSIALKRADHLSCQRRSKHVSIEYRDTQYAVSRTIIQTEASFTTLVTMMVITTFDGCQFHCLHFP